MKKKKTCMYFQLSCARVPKKSFGKLPHDDFFIMSWWSVVVDLSTLHFVVLKIKQFPSQKMDQWWAFALKKFSKKKTTANSGWDTECRVILQASARGFSSATSFTQIQGVFTFGVSDRCTPATIFTNLRGFPTTRTLK